jgi:nitric oxide reductase NorD protein
MEEWVGQWWHRAVTRAADTRLAQAAVTLAQMQRPIGLLFRATGGAAGTRLAPSQAQHHGGARGWLQKVAGSGDRAAPAQLQPEVLALPDELAVFDTAALNRDLYLWLAALAAHWQDSGHFLADNLQATQAVLRQFPGLAPRHARLLAAVQAQRPALGRLRGPAREAEAAVQAALGLAAQARWHQAPALPRVDASRINPVWLWLMPTAPGAAAAPVKREAQDPDTNGRQHAQEDERRRRARQVQESTERNAMMMFFRAESLLTWGEFVRVNRATDDDENDNALAAANDMDELAIAPDGRASASRVRFDLDLPSAAEDDQVLADGERLPEWDHRRNELRAAHVGVQQLQTRDAAPFVPAPALKRTAQRVRRRMELLRAMPRWQRGYTDGEELDLDAWVRRQGEAFDDSPPVHARRVRSERSLATLLLADLSLSTDAHVPGHELRVIDVIRDALYVFGEALTSSGDAFAMQGFSSVKRQLRLQHLKDFDEPWDRRAQARVGAVKPGYYTRMGAALRHATATLAQRPEQQRLLLLLTDGKPNDLDVYEGRYGLEDTRHAVQAARAAGLTPFAVTIDEAGHDWLPYLFGQGHYCLVHQPAQLAQRLAQVVATLTRG